MRYKLTLEVEVDKELSGPDIALYFAEATTNPDFPMRVIQQEVEEIDNVRGRIYNQARKRQLIDASGLRYGDCTITDLDGGFEFGDKVLVLYEIKYKDATIPAGQNALLRRVMNAWWETGRKGIILEATHSIDDPRKDIPLHECIVRRVYVDRGWSYCYEGKTVKNVTDEILADAGFDLNTGRKKHTL